MEAGMFAVREDRDSVSIHDFRCAIDKIIVSSTKNGSRSEGMFA
jgi:ATP-dependent 26S proteasome regulatory subunit